MANTAVVYKSIYGATKKYAVHIAESLNADLFDLDRMKKFEFEKYDTIILGGGIYAGKVNGIKFIVSNADELKGKTIIIFTTGLSDPTVAKNAQEILKSVNKSLPKELRSRVHVFNFCGGIDFKKLKFIHKTIMSVIKKSIEKKSEEERTEEDKKILLSYGGICDMTDMRMSTPLIDFVRNPN